MLDFVRPRPPRGAERQLRTEMRSSRGDYAMHSAKLGDVPVTVFVAPQGNAVAVELSGRGPQVLTGLAAGAVLSEVEEAGEAFGRTEQASSVDTAWRIEAMPELSDDQKATLRRALSL